MFAKQKFDGKCFKCGKKGHKSSNCWMKTDQWCNKCKNKTHDTKDCRGKKDTAKTAVEIPKAEEEKSNSRTFAFTLKDHVNNVSRGKTSPNLMVDTGATSHIINDKSKFINFDKKFDPSVHLSWLMAVGQM